MTRFIAQIRSLALGGLLALALPAAAAPEPASAAEKKESARPPNILLILVDDLGYAELGCHGNTQIPTPHVDALARGGVRFTSGYVSAPVCGPSRAGLLTGRYGQRSGFEFNLLQTGRGISHDDPTLAERLKAAGYTTGLFGKWHVGASKNNLPRERGFDWFYGFLSACRPYTCRPGELGKSLLGDKAPPSHYMSDLLAAEASAFIEQNRDKPWFVYLSFGAVHASPQGGRKLVPQDGGPYVTRYPAIEPEQRRFFAGLLTGMDEAVGTVMTRLRDLKLEEDTLVIFLSDNGGPTWQTTSSNLPLRGSKGDVLEGGIRVPFMMRWKGRLPEGALESRPVISLDILPTVLAAAGIAPDERLEGVNLLPVLKGEKPGLPREALFWRYGDKYAARMGDWKLTHHDGTNRLYNITADIGEATDLAAKNPETVARILAAYEKWNAANIPAGWGRPGKP